MIFLDVPVEISSGFSHFLAESLSLRHLLDTLHTRLPGRTTVLENLTAIRPETLQQIHALHLRFIQEQIGSTQGAARVAIDSTSVHSASAFPVDSKLVRTTVDRLLERMLSCEANKSHRKPSGKLLRWVRQIGQLDHAISFLRKGRKASKTKRRQLYAPTYARCPRNNGRR